MCKQIQTNETTQTLQQQIQTQEQEHQQTNLQESILRPTEAPPLPQEAPLETEIPQRDNLFSDKKQQKHGVETMTAAKLSPEERFDFFAVERKNTFHQQVGINCAGDSEMAYSKACKNALSAIRAYADLDLNTESFRTQSKKLIAARKAIQSNLATIQKDLTALQKKKDTDMQQLGTLIAAIETSEDRSLLPKLQHLSQTLADTQEKMEHLQKDAELLTRNQTFFNFSCDGYLDHRRDVAYPYVSTMYQPESFTLHEGALVSWKDMRDEPLFLHEPSIEDVKQGRLGDCYLQAALTDVILTHPKKLKECMRDNGNGTVTVRFFKKFQSKQDLPPDMLEAFQHNSLTELDDTELLLQILYQASTNSEEELQEGITMKWSTFPENLAERNAIEDRKNALAPEDKEGAQRCQKELMAFREKRLQVARNAMCLFHDKDFLAHPQKAHAFAKALAADAAMQPFLQEMRNYLQTPANQERSEINHNMLAELLAKFAANVTEEQMAAFLKQDRKIIDSLPKEYRETCPLYVTVRKEIPAAVGIPIYNGGPLWIHMIQKAYAASGLHQDERGLEAFAKQKAKEKLGNDYQKEWKTLTPQQQQTLTVETNRLKEEYRYSYEAIEGGHSDAFLQTLFDETPKRVYLPASTPDAVLDKLWIVQVNMTKFLPQEGLKLFNRSVDFLNSQIAIMHLFDCYAEWFKKKQAPFLAQNNEKPYVTYPMTIEDITEDLRQFIRQGAEMKGYSTFFEHFKSMTNTNASPVELEALLREFTEQLIPHLTTILEGMSASLGIQHRMFTKGKEENGASTPLYTPTALDYYEKIQTAIVQHQPLCIGTRQFIPDGASQKGRNGESLNNGLVEMHAYSVLGCKEIDGHKFIRLRNPWGIHIRSYKAISTPNPDGGEPTLRYHTETADTFGKQDGQFLMELNDFMSRVQSIYGLDG